MVNPGKIPRIFFFLNKKVKEFQDEKNPFIKKNQCLEKINKSHNKKDKKEKKIIKKEKREIAQLLKELAIKQNNIKDSLAQLHNEKEKLIQKQEEIQKMSPSAEEISENKTLTINSGILKDQDNNNYLYKFKPIENVSEISLVSYDIPKNFYNITENKNELCYKMDDFIKEKNLTVIPGKYTLNELIESINEMLNDDQLELIVNQTTGLVFIKSTTNSKFSLYRQKESILKTLGFTKLKYNNRTEFCADKLCDLRVDNTVQIFLENIFGGVPFATIDLDLGGSDVHYTKRLDIPKTLDRMKVSFYSEDDKLYNFNGLNNKLTFNITYSRENDKLTTEIEKFSNKEEIQTEKTSSKNKMSIKHYISSDSDSDSDNEKTNEKLDNDSNSDSDINDESSSDEDSSDEDNDKDHEEEEKPKKRTKGQVFVIEDRKHLKRMRKNFKKKKDIAKDIPIFKDLSNINFSIQNDSESKNIDVQGTNIFGVSSSNEDNIEYIKSMQIEQSDTDSEEIEYNSPDNFDSITTLEELEKYAKMKNLDI